jgi:hypothetical protein
MTLSVRTLVRILNISDEDLICKIITEESNLVKKAIRFVEQAKQSIIAKIMEQNRADDH